MGTALYFAGNFSAEEAQLDAIDEAVTTELNAMKKVLEGMPAYWQDEKSTEFITSATAFLAKAQTAKESAIAAGKQTLAGIVKTLQIYS